MTRNEAIETLLGSRFEPFRLVTAMARSLFEHRHPDKSVTADRNALVRTIAERLSDEQLSKLAETFGRDPYPPLILREQARPRAPYTKVTSP